MQSSEGQKNEWSLPGWPWELELFALIFVALAVFVPLGIHATQQAPVSRSLVEAVSTRAWLDKGLVFWSVGIIGVYLVHLILARTDTRLLTASFPHMFAPLFFAMVAYARIYVTARDHGIPFAFARGAVAQMGALALAVIFMTLLLARLQVARYMMKLRDVKWDVSTPARWDVSSWRVLAQIKPLVYAPQYYRAGEKGILVEGWFYVMAVPFRLFHSIGAVTQVSLATAGDFFVSSMRSLVRLELTERTNPIFLSPDNRDEFLKYCSNHVQRLKRGTAPGVRTGATTTTSLSSTQRITTGQTQRLAAAVPDPSYKF